MAEQRIFSPGVNAAADGDIGWITVSNPARHNALSIRMMDALGRTLDRLDADPGVKVIVVRGGGTAAFAAGADISEFEAERSTAEARRRADGAITDLFGTLDRLATPLIAMIHGHCLGAGLALALGADIRIADDRGRFAIPAGRLGLAYPVPLVHALVRAVGPGHAAEILFTAAPLDAAEALRAGLVNRVVASGELEEVTRATAERIAANAPLSVRAAKTAIRSAADPALAAAAERLVEECAESDDAREGRRAFMAKRPPRFTGR
ncbi:enoyl-CoA hydratase-related protein [Actinomadura terrae]|uniref:enoyl-CoA hydratase-related protein n=1 Tax=Actinomadura terrae TaxID=604353 RepID=UPI001FA7909A|nr:enoyl-CoA hydratase-related protein [Actinomadura terrae]